MLLPKLKEMEGPMPRGDQLSRQWRLIELIGRPQGITVDDAARDVAVTIRTVWRELDSAIAANLKEIGYG